MTAIFLYGLVLVLFIISTFKDPHKSKQALKISLQTLIKQMSRVIPMMFLVGIILAVLNPAVISLMIGKQSGFLGILLALVTGAVAHLPSFVAFPFGASLLAQGAGYAQIAAFVSSLMAVGVVSLGMEIDYFGKKVALLRNLSAVIVSLVFALIIEGMV
ncbi:permease [Halanaerobium salsuginis]|uniref:Predicted permease n=1 Tax=Halanaerobium salsuginis TaxID=29563 RepID=A0A1I4K9N2_9FIRM|nr:permease [Halanaerobium salsuginis]SFL75359.1 Predicted permease [Halanaerobium salsuginis]